MTIINVEKINEVHCRVTSEPGIEQELSTFFSFKVPNAHFMPSYKAKIWDGFKRLYSIKDKTLYLSLIHYLSIFAKNNNYTLRFLNTIDEPSSITLEETKSFMDNLKLYGRGEPIEIRNYQYDAVYQSLHDNRKLLLSATSSGKSLIIYSIMRYHLNYNRKIIIIVPTIGLVSQMYNDFIDYSSFNQWDVEENVQKLHNGLSKDFCKNVLITTYQSIVKWTKSQIDTLGDVVVVDEVHGADAKGLTSILEKMVSYKYRIGTTGTIKDSKAHKLQLEGLTGVVHSVVSTKELMDSGQVSQLKIKCIILKHDEEISKVLKKRKSYQDELSYIVDNIKRVHFIAKLASVCVGNTLVLFQFTRHGEAIRDSLLNRVKDGRKVFFINGKTDIELREEVRVMTGYEENAIIVASSQVMAVGINIPSIENIIFASPTKAKIRTLQSIGRGLRLNEGKKYCTLYDIADDLSVKKYQNYTMKHLLERLSIYSKEQFNFKLINIDF